MEGSGSSLATPWMSITTKVEQYFSSMVAISTAALNASRREALFFPGKGKERDQGGRVPKNVSKKQSDCPSRVQPDCEVGAREAYSNVLPTCPQEKRDVSTRHRVRL